MSRESCIRCSFLIALCARQFSLATSLFFNDRKNELGDRFDLMALRPRHHLSNKLFHACRLNLCCHGANRITRVVNLRRHARLQKVS
jgi:hypothetical protein